MINFNWMTKLINDQNVYITFVLSNFQTIIQNQIRTHNIYLIVIKSKSKFDQIINQHLGPHNIVNPINSGQN